MYIKKYLLLSILPLFLLANPIVGKWEINATQTKESISKLSIDEDTKSMLFLLAIKGFSSINCFKNKTCVLEVNDRDSCLGKFNWKKNKNSYLLTAYKEKLCKDNFSSLKDNTKITIDKDKLIVLQEGKFGNFSYIYSKKVSDEHIKPDKISLVYIKYNKVYKSKAMETYTAGADSSRETYFYLVFTEKNKFYSLATTQSNISSVDDVKRIIEKETIKSNLSAKELLEQLKNIPYTSDKKAIHIISILEGSFDPNKDGISSYSFNSYFKRSDIQYKGVGGIKWKPARRCHQITFKANEILSCDNGIEYTLLNQTNTIKNTPFNVENSTSNKDFETKHKKEEERLEKELQDAIKNVM